MDIAFKNSLTFSDNISMERLKELQEYLLHNVKKIVAKGEEVYIIHRLFKNTIPFTFQDDGMPFPTQYWFGELASTILLNLRMRLISEDKIIEF